MLFIDGFSVKQDQQGVAVVGLDTAFYFCLPVVGGQPFCGIDPSVGLNDTRASRASTVVRPVAAAAAAAASTADTALGNMLIKN